MLTDKVLKLIDEMPIKIKKHFAFNKKNKTVTIRLWGFRGTAPRRRGSEIAARVRAIASNNTCAIAERVGNEARGRLSPSKI